MLHTLLYWSLSASAVLYFEEVFLLSTSVKTKASDGITWVLNFPHKPWPSVLQVEESRVRRENHSPFDWQVTAYGHISDVRQNRALKWDLQVIGWTPVHLSVVSWSSKIHVGRTSYMHYVPSFQDMVHAVQNSLSQLEPNLKLWNKHVNMRLHVFASLQILLQITILPCMIDTQNFPRR